jgi:hypothetical protein
MPEMPTCPECKKKPDSENNLEIHSFYGFSELYNNFIAIHDYDCIRCRNNFLPGMKTVIDFYE